LGKEIARGLDQLQQVELQLQGGRFFLRSQIQGHASNAHEYEWSENPV
jgi:hypothetical protein